MLQFFPVEHFFGKALLFLSFGLFILHEEYTDEKVEEEKGTNENENNEKARLCRTCLIFWAIVSSCYVNGLVHDVWPTFERCYDEQSDHRLANVIKILVESFPFSSMVLANPLCVVYVFLFRTVEKHAHECIHAVNGKHQPNDHHNESDISNWSHRFSQGSDNHLELWVVRYDSQGSNHTQHSQHFESRNIRIR